MKQTTYATTFMSMQPPVEAKPAAELVTKPIFFQWLSYDSSPVYITHHSIFDSYRRAVYTGRIYGCTGEAFDTCTYGPYVQAVLVTRAIPSVIAT